VKKQMELKEELKKLKNQLEVGNRQSWKMLKRGTAVMESAESEEFGEEGSRTGCGSCAAYCGRRMGRESCCRVLQELDSREDEGGVYGKVDSLKITSLEM
jgi:hypothetical protein